MEYVSLFLDSAANSKHILQLLLKFAAIQTIKDTRINLFFDHSEVN